MSSGLPYLNKLRKPELVEFAEQTDLQEYVYACLHLSRTRRNHSELETDWRSCSCSYADYNKGELAVALDKHLSDNRSIFSNDKKLADYYKRLSAPPRATSPVKREPRVVVTPSTEKKAPGRRSTKQKEKDEAT